tara:strand:+ start:655 stop:2121 length:1467 start_codon:yes stop_codon:yes gene_type:complete
MANKLSTIFGSDGGAGVPSYVDTTSMPLIDYQEFRSESHNSTYGGTSGWNQYARGQNAQSGNLNKASKNQFGFNLQSSNSNDTNRIYHVICPFQVSDNGNISKGTANTIENSSGTSMSTTTVGRGFNNTTSSTIGNGNIGANTASFYAYGRQYWSGGYNMMSWGGTIGNSNTVTTHDRNAYSDYNSSYPHPNGGHFGRSGGGSQTPYYHMVGYDGNSYNYWSGWYYNSGSYPSHWTNSQIATYSTTTGYHTFPLHEDSTWDDAGYYQYYYTTEQYGFGTVTTSGNQGNQYNNQRDMWTGLNVGNQWNNIGFRLKNDLAIVLNPTTWEFYAYNPSSNSMGSRRQIPMADRRGWASQWVNASSNLFPGSAGSWIGKNRKPWSEPTTAGNVTTYDELVPTADARGFAIRRVIYDSSTYSLSSKIIYQKSNNEHTRLSYDHEVGFQPYTSNWSRAGVNGEILVGLEWQNPQQRVIVRTYDASNMIDKIEAAE